MNDGRWGWLEGETPLTLVRGGMGMVMMMERGHGSMLSFSAGKFLQNSANHLVDQSVRLIIPVSRSVPGGLQPSGWFAAFWYRCYARDWCGTILFGVSRPVSKRVCSLSSLATGARVLPGRIAMRSLMNRFRSVQFVSDRQDRSNIVHMLQLRVLASGPCAIMPARPFPAALPVPAYPGVVRRRGEASRSWRNRSPRFETGRGMGVLATRQGQGRCRNSVN